MEDRLGNQPVGVRALRGIVEILYSHTDCNYRTVDATTVQYVQLPYSICMADSDGYPSFTFLFMVERVIWIACLSISHL